MHTFINVIYDSEEGDDLNNQAEILSAYSSKKISSGLQVLLKHDEISNANAAAAERWYKDYVLGVIGAKDPEMKTSGKKPDAHASMISRIQAVSRCKLVQNSLGKCSEYRLRLLLVDDLSFSAIAAIFQMNNTNGRKKIAAQMAFFARAINRIIL